ncbi:MAG: hypothetical protein IT463_10440 [Planctomycetes bacterium]|nr:hypothetical protein [Planctomycetota bacterium]
MINAANAAANAAGTAQQGPNATLEMFFGGMAMFAIVMMLAWLYLRAKQNRPEPPLGPPPAEPPAS